MTYSTLVNFFDSWSTSGSGVSTRSSARHTTRHTTGHTTGHTAGHTTRCSSSTLVHLCHNGGADTFKLLLLMLELILFSSLVGIQPSDDLVAFINDAFLFIFADFVLYLIVFDSRFHVKSVAFQAILRLDFLPGGLIFLSVVGCLGDHTINF